LNTASVFLIAHDILVTKQLALSPFNLLYKSSDFFIVLKVRHYKHVLLNLSSISLL